MNNEIFVIKLKNTFKETVNKLLYKNINKLHFLINFSRYYQAEKNIQFFSRE